MAVEDLSYRCWLDPIIEQQAQHYGLSREKFTSLMSGAASVQEQIDTHQIDEPVSTTYRGYLITEVGPTNFLAAGTGHGSLWSAKCYIDELLAP